MWRSPSSFIAGVDFHAGQYKNALYLCLKDELPVYSKQSNSNATFVSYARRESERCTPDGINLIDRHSPFNASLRGIPRSHLVT